MFKDTFKCAVFLLPTNNKVKCVEKKSHHDRPYFGWTTYIFSVDSCNNTTRVILLRLSKANETMGLAWTPKRLLATWIVQCPHRHLTLRFLFEISPILSLNYMSCILCLYYYWTMKIILGWRLLQTIKYTLFN